MHTPNDVPFYELPMYYIAQALDYLQLYEGADTESLKRTEEELYNMYIPTKSQLALDRPVENA